MRWDGTSVAKVELQDSMKNEVCGICGNFNGDPDDDWVVGPSDTCMTKYPDATAGEVVSTALYIRTL